MHLLFLIAMGAVLQMSGKVHADYLDPDSLDNSLNHRSNATNLIIYWKNSSSR
jgi:hypothetical protein